MQHGIPTVGVQFLPLFYCLLGPVAIILLSTWTCCHYYTVYVNLFAIILCLLSCQELTEEGLPFMILFHKADDAETPEIFRRHVASNLIAEKSRWLNSKGGVKIMK